MDTVTILSADETVICYPGRPMMGVVRLRVDYSQSTPPEQAIRSLSMTVQGNSTPERAYYTSPRYVEGNPRLPAGTAPELFSPSTYEKVRLLNNDEVGLPYSSVDGSVFEIVELSYFFGDTPVSPATPGSSQSRDILEPGSYTFTINWHDLNGVAGQYVLEVVGQLSTGTAPFVDFDGTIEYSTVFDSFGRGVGLGDNLWWDLYDQDIGSPESNFWWPGGYYHYDRYAHYPARGSGDTWSGWIENEDLDDEWGGFPGPAFYPSHPSRAFSLTYPDRKRAFSSFKTLPFDLMDYFTLGVERFLGDPVEYALLVEVNCDYELLDHSIHGPSVLSDGSSRSQWWPKYRVYFWSDFDHAENDPLQRYGTRWVMRSLGSETIVRKNDGESWRPAVEAGIHDELRLSWLRDANGFWPSTLFPETWSSRDHLPPQPPPNHLLSTGGLFLADPDYREFQVYPERTVVPGQVYSIREQQVLPLYSGIYDTYTDYDYLLHFLPRITGIGVTFFTPTTATGYFYGTSGDFVSHQLSHRISNLHINMKIIPFELMEEEGLRSGWKVGSI